jgi:O-antigen/teichoic acid export membrane protein
MITAPVAVGMGLVADPLVRLFLGDKWLEAVPMLQALAIFGLLQISSGNIGPVFLAMGRPRLVMIVTAISTVIGIPLTLFATLQWGVIGTIWSLVVMKFAVAIVLVVLIVRVLKLSPAGLLGAVWRSFIALSAMVLVVGILSAGFTDADNAQSLPIILASEIIAGALVYIGIHLWLWRLCGCPDGSERLVWNALAAKIGRKEKILAT